jgi:hypothetical protein
MTINEARALFSAAYTKAGVKIQDEADTPLKLLIGGRWIEVEDQSLEDHAAIAEDLATFHANPVPTSLCSTTYREQLIGTSVAALRPMGLLDTESDISYGVADGLHVTIGPPSKRFLEFQRLKPDFLAWWVEEANRRARVFKSKKTLRAFDPRVLTIKVLNMKCSTDDEAVETSNSLIDACLFKVAVSIRRALNVKETWGGKRRQALLPTWDESCKELPKIAPINDLLKLYVLAIGSSYAALRFLALYQILEYFFLKTADERLYSRLKSRIGDLGFRCDAKHFDRLIQDVTEHKRENDEKEMLRAVLEKYVDEEEMITFIQSTESGLTKDKPFTSKQDAFGTALQIAPTKGHAIPTAAKSIKAIRNALVHSSDRHERRDRYIPFSPDTKVIEDYIPLLDFLAQKIMIATGSSFN